LCPVFDIESLLSLFALSGPFIGLFAFLAKELVVQGTTTPIEAVSSRKEVVGHYRGLYDCLGRNIAKIRIRINALSKVKV
jgi:hypothetical protein